MDKTKKTIEKRDYDELPAYSQLSKLHVLPSYRSACPLTPYRPFPTVIHACRHLPHLQTLIIQDAQANPIYRAESRSGFNKIEPLGSRAGILLRNGLSSRDDVLAAAGEKSPWARYAKDGGAASSVFFLPPFEIGTNSRAMVMETMRKAHDRPAAFTFFVETEPIREWKRHKFQWVQLPDRMDTLCLLRCQVGRGVCGTGEETEATASSSSSSSSMHGEAVATLLFRDSSGTSRAFTLTMLGTLGQGVLGERCTLAVVVTALFVWSRRKGLLQSEGRQ